jgi:hypothetical protein
MPKIHTEAGIEEDGGEEAERQEHGRKRGTWKSVLILAMSPAILLPTLPMSGRVRISTSAGLMPQYQMWNR